MGFLQRLERALQERLEPASTEHPYEAALALWRLLAGHRQPGGFCPNRLFTPTPLDAVTLRELDAHIEERGFRLAAPLHQVPGALGVGFGWPDRPQAAALVEVMDGPSRGKLGLVNGRLVIGRGEDCELRLGDPSVSRQHCVLLGDLTLEDLNSRSGVLVDSQRIRRVRLRDGQTFVIGSHSLRAVDLS